MPNRIIREGLITSERIGRVSIHAEMVFVRLILSACPRGRFHADPSTVKQLALTNRSRFRQSDLITALDELERAGLIVRYSAPSGSALLQIPRYGQRLKYRRSKFPPPPGEPPDQDADTGSEEKRSEENETPPSPPLQGGGAFISAPSGSKGPSRVKRRLPKLADLKEELELVEREMREILRPGGCAYNVTPQGEKALRLEKLSLERDRLWVVIKKVRAALSD